MLGLHMQRHGLDFVTAARDLGAWAEDTKPDRNRKPRTLSEFDKNTLTHRDTSLVWVFAQNMRNGVVLTDADHAALSAASHRIEWVLLESCP